MTRYALRKLANRFRMVAEYFRARPGRTIYPQEVVIELTNHCNLACRMCPQATLMRRPKGFMEAGLFRKIIDEIKSRAELVYLYGTGESLLHPDLVPLTEYAARSGLTTVLSTNGIPLTEKTARSLLSSGLDYLIIALDGGVKETYESIRIKGDFGRLVGNIKTLLRLHRETGSPVKIVLQMIYMKANAHEREQFRNLFTDEERRRIFQFRFKPFYETYADHSRAVDHNRPCYWLWNMMAIAYNGDAQLCCMDYEAGYIGRNVREASVEEVWNSAPFAAARAAHRNLDYASVPLCVHCDIPEQGYFSGPLILGSALVDADTVRRLLPLYEKLLLRTTRAA